MIIGLSLIHVQFLLVWANNGWILVQSIQWLNSLFVLEVYGLDEGGTFHFLETNLSLIFYT